MKEIHRAVTDVRTLIEKNNHISQRNNDFLTDNTSPVLKAVTLRENHLTEQMGTHMRVLNKILDTNSNRNAKRERSNWLDKQWRR
jgi:hypothetical protein